METFQVFVLALIQGLTEFLPISSSAHLIFPSQLLGWPDQGLAFDVAVHMGTLMAVVFYLRHEIANLWSGWVLSVKQGKLNDQGRIAWGLVLATLPAGLAGLWLDDYVELYLRSILVIASTTLLFGLLLAWADYKPAQNKTLLQVNWGQMLLIGVAQVFALIPGTSRSGVTMTAGLMLGLDRQDAAKFSFLLSIPLIAAIGLFKTFELVSADTSVDWFAMALGFTISCISAFLCIRWFINLVNHLGFMPFVIYRVVLAGILFFLYFGSSL